MRIGVGVPVHVDDAHVLSTVALPAIKRLNPPPENVLVYWNKGPDLQTVRRRMFDTLFAGSIDVAMSVSADYAVMPDILRHVSEDKVTTFAFLSRHPRDLPLTLATLLGFGWSACFSVPREIWPYVREYLRDDDSDVKKCLSRSQIKRVRLPRYYEYRYAEGTPRTSWGVHRRKSLLARARWMALRLAAIQ